MLRVRVQVVFTASRMTGFVLRNTFCNSVVIFSHSYAGSMSVIDSDNCYDSSQLRWSVLFVWFFF